MRRHEIAVAVLHLLSALFIAGCVAVIWVAAALLAPLFAGTFVPDLIAMVGRPVAIFLLAVAALDGIAAGFVIARPGSRAARVLIVIGIPLVMVFPIGSAIALYTWWALRWNARRDAMAPEALAVRASAAARAADS